MYEGPWGAGACGGEGVCGSEGARGAKRAPGCVRGSKSGWLGVLGGALRVGGVGASRVRVSVGACAHMTQRAPLLRRPRLQ